MSARPTHESPAGRLYLALRKKARDEGRRTDELLHLAALEAFVDRLASSPRAEQLVLKGGVLLAAYDARRPTKDVDLAAHGLSNEPAAMAAVIESVLAVQREDGWTFGRTNAETIRDEAEVSRRAGSRAVLARQRRTGVSCRCEHVD
ncbi:MAG: abortive infection protein AbiGII [Myxococcaceae bacterium]|nr:abortive infection protein AbiGII [Myxococcaceae bacterium]